MGSRSLNYRHFNSHLDRFNELNLHYRLASINNHFVDPDTVGVDHISHFIRDPRDLVVSGYFYHLRGAEKWCNIQNPSHDDWKKVNGTLPTGMKSGETFTSFLNRISFEDGLKAEVEFRKNHFDSMRLWPRQHKHLRTYRYEDFIGNEVDIMQDIFSFHELDWVRKTFGRYYSRKLAVSNQQGRDSHIRNPQPGQWKQHFSSGVEDFFEELHGDLPESLGYS